MNRLETIMHSNKNIRYLSVKQVAELLGFHPETIKRWARDGKIEVQQAGHYGHIRVKWPLVKPGASTRNSQLLQRGTGV
jgi:excisionase family DNA binding protein